MATPGMGMGLGDLLGQQTAMETDEERRKRLAQQQSAQRTLSPLSTTMTNTRPGALSSVYSGAY